VLECELGEDERDERGSNWEARGRSGAVVARLRPGAAVVLTIEGDDEKGLAG
jgi:hypothetical protein